MGEMTDILNLLDTDIPLIKRYDSFLEWENQYSFTVINLAAERLGIGIAHVEVFYELGKLDDDEFVLIDNASINIDSLVLIIKEERAVRLKVYSDYNVITNNNQPIKNLKEYIDKLVSPSFNEVLNKVKPEVYAKISSYLKQRGIENEVMTKRFRAFLVTCSKTLSKKGELSQPQIDWIVGAISHDRINALNIFTNDILKKDYPDDFKLFVEVIELTKKYKLS